MTLVNEECFRRPALVAGRLAVLLLFAALAGCGPSNKRMPAPADPAQGRSALQTALEAWKSGATPEALLAGKPPIRVSDDDWRAGRKLISYQVAEQGEPVGLAVRYGVVLALESRPGEQEQRNVSYSVSTSPSLVVMRYDPDS